MPLSRYQIRSEYSLADADLYRAADKDDPEALLEGLAMAGLVGVLRQLGDLAEFAAEIFHDLHEEVMATASRGHSLMFRVQQLEADFPTIEKAFLSQINHSAFFYNAGMDWHPNMRTDPNVITRGDLPRFIMDSYEECRGPPHLFLLDKFDVAGAGACLKRYTDPSVFKTDMSYSGIASTDVLREKKTRKAKKKGSRWRNGETPETLPTSHAKLHQLFLEERIENGTNYSAHCVKLRRRLNGFPLNSKYGKSYMEKLLKSPSPDHEKVHEIPVDPSPLALPSTNIYDSSSEIVEIGILSPDKDSKQRMRCLSSSPTREGTTLELVMDEQNEGPCTKENSEVSKSNSNLDANDIFSTLQKVVSEKEILVDGGIKTEGSGDDYQSDDIASEIDNYVDALATMESEMDTDSELRSKNNLCHLNSGRQASDVDRIGERVQAHSSDLLSIGNSTLSDENSSAKKDISRFSYSSSHSVSAENIHSDGEVSSNVFSSPEIHETETSPTRKSINEEGKLLQPPGGTVSDGVFTETVEIPRHSSKLGGPSASSSPSDSAPVSENADAVVKEIASVGPETGEVVENLSRELPFIPSISDAWEQKGDLSLKFSGENQHSDEFEDKDTNEIEDLGCTSYLCVSPLCRDGLPFQVSVDNKLDDELQDDVNYGKIVASTSDCLIVHDIMNENPFLLSSENQPLENSHDEGPNWSNNSSSTSNPSDPLWHNKDDLSPKMSKNLPVDDFTVKDHSFLLDATICTSDIMEAATEKKFIENMLDNVPQIGNAEDVLVQNSVENQTCPHNLVIPHTEDLSINPTNAESETHYSSVEPVERVSEVSDAIPSAGERSENVILKEDTPIISKSVDSFVSGTTADIPVLGASKERTLYVREGFSDDPSNVKHDAVVDEAAYNPDSLETDTAPESSLMAGVHVHFDEVDHEPVNAPAGFTDHDDHTFLDDDDISPVDLKKLQGGSLSCVKNGRIGLESGTCFLDRPGESEITDDKCSQKFASPDLNSLCNTVIDDYSGPQVFDDASNEYVISGSGSKLNLGNAPTCQSSVQHGEEELKPTCQSSVQHGEEELKQLEERFDLQPKELDDKLLIGGEANSQLSNQLQQIHNSNHDDQIGPFDASTELLLVNIDSQLSASELLPQGNSKIDTGHSLDPSCSISSGISLLTDSSQIYVEEMPPLPPLPPVQWRMGKLQHANPIPERLSANHNAAAFPSLLPSSANQEVQPLNPFLPQSVLAYDKSTPVSEQPMYDNSLFLPQVPPMVHDAAPKDNVLPLEGIQIARTLLKLPVSHGDMLQNDFHAGNGEKVTSLDSFSNAPAVDTASAENLSSSREEVKRPLDLMTRETSLKDMELGQCPTHSEENVVTCDTTDQALNVAECAIPTSEENLSWPTAEDGKLHGIRTMKLTQPRSPVIDAVAAHDKSRLRKVTERVRPQIQKEEERDSLLEQIKAKSFNLKPAVVTRPSIQGPKTNLKVTAILEKAKTIRQALAGSDEDDDSWSDS